MAQQEQKQNDKPDDAQKQKDEQKRNPGTPSQESTDTAETQVAAKAGISEGDLKAVRDDAGRNQLAGHEATVHDWAASDAGKAHKDGEKERDKAAKAEEKRYEEQAKKDGLSEADAKYREVVGND